VVADAAGRAAFLAARGESLVRAHGRENGSGWRALDPWWRMIYWIRRKHPHLTWKQIRRRYYGADRIREGTLVLYNPATMCVERYRYRDTPDHHAVQRRHHRSGGRSFPSDRPR
jgi:hypothetical protein